MAGSFSGTPQRQADSYKLTLGVVAPKIAYADCKVVLTINGTFETAQMINISGGNEFPANNIIWTDLLEDGIVNVGDSLVVSDPVSTVTYFVAIIWAPFGNSICTQTWTVP